MATACSLSLKNSRKTAHEYRRQIHSASLGQTAEGGIAVYLTHAEAIIGEQKVHPTEKQPECVGGGSGERGNFL